MRATDVLGWIFLVGGIFALVATRIGWYDEDGLMRRMDWFDIYGTMERSWIGGGVRRANYTVFGVLLVIGMLVLVRAA